MEGFKKKSFACTRIKNKPLTSSLLGKEKETNVFNSILNKPDGNQFSPDQRTKHHIATPAVLEDWINVTTIQSQMGLPCQQPLKQDEAYAAKTCSGENELSCPAMTQG